MLLSQSDNDQVLKGSSTRQHFFRRTLWLRVHSHVCCIMCRINIKFSRNLVSVAASLSIYIHTRDVVEIETREITEEKREKTRLRSSSEKLVLYVCVS